MAKDRTNVKFKLVSGADFKVISTLLFDPLPVAQTEAYQCKAKLQVYDGRKITPKGKASLVFVSTKESSQCWSFY